MKFNLTLSLGWLAGWVGGDLESKVILTSNLKLKLKLAEAGNRSTDQNMDAIIREY